MYTGRVDDFCEKLCHTRTGRVVTNYCACNKTHKFTCDPKIISNVFTGESEIHDLYTSFNLFKGHKRGQHFRVTREAQAVCTCMNACTVASGQLAHVVCSMSAKCSSPKQCKCDQIRTNPPLDPIEVTLASSCPAAWQGS